MGYPYDKTYLEQIKENKRECDEIRKAYWVLRSKYRKDHNLGTEEDLSLPEMFQVLGEAFELSSNTLNGISDEYHFMWDVLDELLGEECFD